jgi:uncharacterized membrane protein
VVVGEGPVSKSRLEAFSDGVIAIVITIMVLELRMPEGDGLATLHAALPGFLLYVLSFVMLGIYWNNHHHMLHTVDKVTGGVLWANLHLLFWLSLVPVTTGWMGEHYKSALPTAVYGVVLLCAAIAYYILQGTIITSQGAHSRLRAAIGRDLKGRISPVIYAVAIAAAFVLPWAADACYVGVALMWLVPDRRIESTLRR